MHLKGHFSYEQAGGALKVWLALAPPNTITDHSSKQMRAQQKVLVLTLCDCMFARTCRWPGSHVTSYAATNTRGAGASICQLPWQTSHRTKI